MTCPRCGGENEPDRKFCGECGARLARACAACGTPNTQAAKFCGECGAPLDAAPVAANEPAAAELRLVTVLFVDLVGYTSLSESRDAEDVRELLSRYFDTARTIVGRYGGVVEKFIGDAVMAVWGRPPRARTTPRWQSGPHSTSSTPSGCSAPRRASPSCRPGRGGDRPGRLGRGARRGAGRR